MTTNRVEKVRSNKTVFIVMLFFMIVLSGVIVPMLFVQVRGYPAHSLSTPGTPIEMTPFAPLVSEALDPVMLPDGTVGRVMLPGGSVNRTQDTITVTADYYDSVSVNLAEAVTIAQDFISGVPYLAGRAFSPELNMTMYDEAIWRLILLDDRGQMRLGVSVNAISGSIAGLSAHWVSPLANPFKRTFNASTALNEKQVIEEAIQFLQNMNYTLSPHTNVIGPTVKSGSLYLSYDAYVIRLVNVIDGVFVKDNELSLILDVESGTVHSFSYHWTSIPDFSTEDVIEPSDAEKLALRYMSQNEDGATVSVAWSALVLLHYFPVNGSTYMLQWVVAGVVSSKYSYSFTVFVYPLSGVVRLLPTLYILDDVYVRPVEVWPIHIASTLGLALVTGSLFFIVVRKRVTVFPSNEPLVTDERTEDVLMLSADE